MIQPVTAPNYPVEGKHCACQSQPSYNAVKIDVHNPAVNVQGNQVQQPVQQMPMGMPQQMPMSQDVMNNGYQNPAIEQGYAPAGIPNNQAQQGYAPVTNPYYNYPQNSVYNCPACPPCPNSKPEDVAVALDAKAANVGSDEIIKEANELLAVLAAERAALDAQKADLEALKQQSAQQPAIIQQQNFNAPVNDIPEPKVVKNTNEVKNVKSENKSEVAEDVKAPVVEEPVQSAPQIDLNAFLAKLSDKDFEVQAAAMEAIAGLVKENPQLATELLDEKVVNSLRNILKNDSTKLEGPNAEQIAARKKLIAGQKLTDAEAQLANTITPMEQSERNKSYAMFTLAIMQKLYGDEVKKLANTTVPLTELPAAADVVEQLAANPNPMVRISAIEALSYIQQPEYKDDLKALFKVALNDKDANVQQAAKAALSKLDALQA